MKKSKKIIAFVMVVMALIAGIVFLVMRYRPAERSNLADDMKAEKINAEKVIIIVYPDSLQADSISQLGEGDDDVPFFCSARLTTSEHCEFVKSLELLEKHPSKKMVFKAISASKRFIVNGQPIDIPVESYRHQCGVILINGKRVNHFNLKGSPVYVYTSYVDTIDKYLQLDIEAIATKYIPKKVNRAVEEQTEKYRLEYENTPKYLGFNPDEPLPDSLLIKQNDALARINNNMIMVEGGTYNMGGTVQIYFPGPDEFPVHKVTVASFMMSKFKVTQGDWFAIMGYYPFKYEPCSDCPIVSINYYEILVFIDRLNKIEGTNKFYLPSEEEWEYAARSGKFLEDYAYSGSDNYDEVAVTDNPTSKNGKACDTCMWARVGTKKPNRLGIYDMTSICYELCSPPYRDYPQSYKSVRKRRIDYTYMGARGSSMDIQTTDGEGRVPSRYERQVKDRSPSYSFRLAKKL